MEQRTFAKHLRSQMTESEQRLWRHLRAHRLRGEKFKRQQPIGPYIVDFVHFGSRLIVEADGGQHNESTHDEQRDTWLRAQGFKVLRFWNNDIMNNLEAVLETVLAAVIVSTPLSPNPSPTKGGGEGNTPVNPDPSTTAHPPHKPSPLAEAGLGEREAELSHTPLSLDGRGVGGEGANNPHLDWLLPLAIFLALLTLYGLTAPRTVALEDDGLFIMVAWFNGVAHPPGYPLWTLLAHPFSHIEFGPSVAWRVHFLSGIFGALACALLWFLARQLGMTRFVATLTALGYGVSQIFWSQAIIAEVYTLHILITFALMNTLMAWRKRAFAGKDTHLMGTFSALLFGLGLSNHWPMLVLTSPAFLFIAWPALRQKPMEIFRLLPWVVLGLFPYAIMVINSLSDPMISFLGPIDSWQRFEDYILRRHYSGVDNSPTANWQDKLQFIGFILRQISIQFGPVGFLLLVLGFYTRMKAFRNQHNTIDPALIVGVLGTTIVLLCLLNFDYDTFHKALFQIFPITAYAFLSLFMGIGIQHIIISTKHGKRFAVITVLPFLVILLPLGLHLRLNYRPTTSWADNYGRTLLTLPPRNSIIFLDTDFTMGPVGYLHHIEKVRPDITLINSESLVFNSRLTPSHWDPSLRQSILRQFQTTSERPVYFEGHLPYPHASTNLAILRALDPHGHVGKEQFIFDDRLLSFFNWMVQQAEPNDVWEKMLRNWLMGPFGYYFSRIESIAPEINHQPWHSLVMKLLSKHFYANLLIAKTLLVEEDESSTIKAINLLKLAETQQHAVLTTEGVAQMYLLTGIAYERIRQYSLAIEYYKKSINYWPHPKAEARQHLRTITDLLSNPSSQPHPQQ